MTALFVIVRRLAAEIPDLGSQVAMSQTVHPSSIIHHPISGLPESLDRVVCMSSNDFELTVDAVNLLVKESFGSAYRGGFRCEELGDGVALARWVFDEDRLRPGAYIPGPTMFGIADIALWFAVFTVVGIEPMAVTSEMSVRFLRPALGGDLLARAVINSTSKRRAVGTIEIWVDGTPDRLVAVAQGTYALPTS